jgi:hypothetical protein
MLAGNRRDQSGGDLFSPSRQPVYKWHHGNSGRPMMDAGAYLQRDHAARLIREKWQ